MCRLLFNAGKLALPLIMSLQFSGQVSELWGQETDIKTARKTEEGAVKGSTLSKPHFSNGNRAMQDAQAIRQQLQMVTNEQKPALLSQMKADYQTAITEYEQALQETEVRNENGVQVIGLIGVIRNGLVSRQKAADMLVQDKDLPVILSNLGLAYSGVGEYQEAITVLEQAAILKPTAGTYMELGTDQAQVGRMQEAAAACDKVLTVDPAAKNMLAGCYKNIAIVLTNKGNLADAITPLQKATQINSQDALAWKLLGDALTNTIISKSEGGKVVYVIPPGTIEAYERYLQLEPNGPYAGEVQAAVEGLTKLTKVPTETKEKN
ncbi:MAG TPA: tetratricopeptide repeat protein [Candidatus Acidoferrum sp.]|jgi:tetratricopeptide (TPR) repeat protein|nr:tetratricopeptide repeat protein [Candidatus Acidoferrum sp.]